MHHGHYLLVEGKSGLLTLITRESSGGNRREELSGLCTTSLTEPPVADWVLSAVKRRSMEQVGGLVAERMCRSCSHWSIENSSSLHTRGYTTTTTTFSDV